VSASSTVQPPICGVWLPIVTPFLGGAVDLDSYERLLGYYLTQGISGVIPLGTTGESPTLEDHEAEAIVALTVDVVDRRIPIYVGVGGNSTRNVIQMLRRLERYPFAGILSTCPYYSRPSEEGIREHFRQIAESTDKNVLIYNIPYRTGVNLSNDAVLDLSQVPNIVGIKDCCASLAQSVDLLRRKPPGFSVMTGEDALFYTSLALNGDGGIVAAAHYRPQSFVEVFQRMAANDHRGALAVWSSIEPMVRMLFREPNPMPLKHWLWREGFIDSPECRLPLTRGIAMNRCPISGTSDPLTAGRPRLSAGPVRSPTKPRGINE
jgi:4-hydroxy-tetrahydrodipicolinate synthase